MVSLDYSKDASEIILAVDVSLKRWEGVLMQLVKGKKHPSRYKSGTWFSIEKKYNTTKQKCRRILKALKKVRYWLYKIRFVLETDARVLVAQLNQLDTDLSGA